MSAALLLASLTLTGAGVSAPARGGPVAALPLARTWTLAQDVMLLTQLEPLKLSEGQVGQLLGLYGEWQNTPDDERAVLERLESLRDRLLRGEEVRLVELRTALSMIRNGRRAGRGEADGDRLDRVMDVLKDWQKAVLAGGPLRVGANAGRLRAAQEPLVEVLVAIANTPDERWQGERQAMIQRVAGAVVEERAENTAVAVGEFLDRVHHMDENQVRARAEELVQEAEALAVTPVPMLLLLQAPKEAEVRERAARLFLDPAMPRLLRAMAEARGWQVAE